MLPDTYVPVLFCRRRLSPAVVVSSFFIFSSMLYPATRDWLGRTGGSVIRIDQPIISRSHTKLPGLPMYCPASGFSKVKEAPRPIFPQSAAGKGFAKRGRHWQSADARWWKFRHPKFRQGRKELLSGVKRRQERTRSKYRRGEACMHYPRPSIEKVPSTTWEGQCVFAFLR